MSDVRLDNISKHFRETVAVESVSVTIEEGEFFSLLGPSGCGKTTTLRMIGGFEEPTNGRIFIGEADVTELPAYRRDVNTVFQSYALFPHLNVFDNVAYGLKRRKVDGAEIKKRVEEMLELVDLKGFGQRRIAQLSGGQQQRVALARALVNRPAVLLLDEPLGALDLKLRKQMQLELKRIQSEVGITFIYVTHDQDEAMTMSDRIAVMNAGRIEQLGSPRDVYEVPGTSFVASFLGASNLLGGRVESADGEFAKIRLDAGVTASVPAERLPGKAGERVGVGVRPEKLRILPLDATSADANSLEGRVLQTSYTGVSTSYQVQTEDGSLVVAYVQNLEAGEQLAQGDRVRLTWLPEHTFVVSGDPDRKGELG